MFGIVILVCSFMGVCSPPLCMSCMCVFFQLLGMFCVFIALFRVLQMSIRFLLFIALNSSFLIWSGPGVFFILRDCVCDHGLL